MTSTRALKAAATPEAPLIVPPVTTRTASQKTTSKQFKIAFALVLGHLRKRRVCSVRSWYAITTSDLMPCIAGVMSVKRASSGGRFRLRVLDLPL
jgi:hypothetical protein